MSVRAMTCTGSHPYIELVLVQWLISAFLRFATLVNLEEIVVAAQLLKDNYGHVLQSCQQNNYLITFSPLTTLIFAVFYPFLPSPNLYTPRSASSLWIKDRVVDSEECCRRTGTIPIRQSKGQDPIIVVRGSGRFERLSNQSLSLQNNTWSGDLFYRRLHVWECNVVTV